ncbi:MAG: glycerophosphodiester phosphodiesterase family protein [Ignavibacteriales bacterium]|nr:glycerophosphodiester phosphodiesterase family protein [Ignavibacteriales bacterium]
MQPYQPKPPHEHRPYVVAHRGISGKVPENTLAAFERACETPGIDMIELDVRLSKDDQVIVLHDRTLQRTTTGNGAARHYSIAEIKEFDAGSWFDPSFSNERIPTLEEVLALVNKRRWVNIELKSDFFFPEKHELLEDRALDTVKNLGYRDHVLFSSFNHQMVGTIKRLDQGARTGVLYNIYRDYGRMPSKLAGRVGAEVLVCAKHELTQRMLRDAQQSGVAVYVYTLNSTAVVDKMIEMGVDGILSDIADDIVRFVKNPTAS